MPLPKREKFANAASTTLNGGIDSTQTTLVVDDASNFPTDGDFRILVESEIMLVTGVSGTTFTVVRGAESTTNTAHADEVAVIHIVTEESIQRLTFDNVNHVGNAPPLARITNASGNIVTASGMTWLNQGSATAADNAGTIRLFHPTGTSSLNVRGLYLSAPGVTTWSATVGFNWLAHQHGVFGLMARESGTSRFMWSVVTSFGRTILVERFTNPTTFVSSALNVFHDSNGGLVWMRFRRETTNIYFDVSSNGIDWIQVHTESTTNFFTTAPDQAGFVFNAANTSAAQFAMNIFHFSFTG